MEQNGNQRYSRELPTTINDLNLSVQLAIWGEFIYGSVNVCVTHQTEHTQYQCLSYLDGIKFKCPFYTSSYWGPYFFISIFSIEP